MVKKWGIDKNTADMDDRILFMKTLKLIPSVTHGRLLYDVLIVWPPDVMHDGELKCMLTELTRVKKLVILETFNERSNTWLL
jgi:hypothetical protein